MLMKRIVALVGLLTLGLCFKPRLLRADDGATWHPFGALDYLGVGNAKQTAQETLNSMCSQLGPSCGYSANVYGGYGARAGVFYGNSSDIQWGGSIGYLYGGPYGSGKGNISVTPTGNFADTITNNTLRLLAEAKKSFKINSDWKFNLGAGLGWAMDAESDNYSSSGSLAANGSGTPTSQFGWATWEISPGFEYHHTQIGLRYVGFARGGSNPWNTYGAFLGYEF